MRSTRLAILSVAIGSALLGWSTAGVSAVADGLSQDATPSVQQQPDHDCHDHHGPRRGERGV